MKCQSNKDVWNVSSDKLDRLIFKAFCIHYLVHLLHLFTVIGVLVNESKMLARVNVRGSTASRKETRPLKYTRVMDT